MPMKIIHLIDELRSQLAQSREIALVPTMGNLHEGHLNLVRLAREKGKCVVVSIFVNPLQFLPHEDFNSYPRTFADDCEKLSRLGCDLVFAPSDAELYPDGRDGQGFRAHPPSALADQLEGHFRPGFFVGVSTVVLKLFNIVQPSWAVFGKKDYQQWRVIAQMVRELNLPITIIVGETVREADGLAMSSRNGYLSASERGEAVHLSRALRQGADALQQLRQNAQTINGQAIRLMEEAAQAYLRHRGWAVDYIACRSADNLMPITEAILPSAPVPPLIVLGAAKIGQTRLIDNLEITLH